MEKMKHIIKAALFTPTRQGWGLTLAFRGGPGVGKSQVIESLCGAFGLHCQVLSPGEMGEGAFGVVPVPTEDGFLSYPPHEWVKKLADHNGRGLVFIDELTTAPRALQPYLLALTLARRLGGYYLGSGVRTICAFNPPGTVNGTEINKAQANRLCHVNWDAGDVEQWVDYLISDDGLSGVQGSDSAVAARPFDAAAEEARVLKAWPEPYATAKGGVAGFLMARPALLHQEPEDSDPRAGGAWASRRAWEATTRALATAQVHNLSEDERHLLVAGYVGLGPAKELLSFLDTEKFSPRDILEGKEKFEHEASRLDRTHAVLTGCTALVVQQADKKQQERLARSLWKILDTTAGQGSKAIVVPAARILMNKDLYFDDGKAVLRKLEAVLSAARTVA